MKRILITGANKGIGLACVKAALEYDEDIFILLGARNAIRGRAAIDELCRTRPDWTSRLELLEIDVAIPASVETARETLEKRYPSEPKPLYGLVNNAGMGLSSADLKSVIEVNTLGAKRVCDALLPLLESAGRIVNVSSASGPKFVDQCTQSRRDFFQDAATEWQEIEQLVDAALTTHGDAEQIKDLGLGNLNAYGFSKACLSLYTLLLAREHPQLYINACTPGYIETDLTRPQAESRGVAPSDIGMKPPAAGTLPILFLLFGSPISSGHYYGSDAKRSPLDRYRAPGSPEYTGV